MGQEDLSAVDSNFKIAVDLVREKIGNKILGLSTHNLEEIEIANTLDLNYIGLGAYRATNTKSSVDIKGKSLLDISKKSNHKVALIGGVTLEDDFSKLPQISYRVIGSNLMHSFLQKGM